MHKQTGQPLRLKTVQQTAEILGVAPVTIRKWLIARKMAFVKVGGATRISEAEIERFVADGTVPANVA